MKEKFREFYGLLVSNEGTLFIYAFAYAIIVGIAPILVIAVLFLGSQFLDPLQLVAFITNYIPKELVDPLVSYLQLTDLSNLGFVMTLLGTSIWLSSKSIYSFLIISATNDDLNIKHYILRIMSLFYFIMLIFAVAAIIVIIGFVSVLRNIAIFLAIFTTLVLFYRMISFKYISFRNLLPGALVATAGILGLGRLFFYYINNFSNYTTIYGPFASLMILFIAGYVISWILYVGYCINYVTRNKTGKTSDKAWFIEHFTDDE